MPTRSDTHFGRIQPPAQSNPASNPVQTEKVLDEPLIPTGYNILDHLNTIPAWLSALQLIKDSQPHQQALYSVLNKSCVRSNINPEALGTVASFTFGDPSIIFTDRDLLEPEYHYDPLHVTVSLNDHEVKGTLIDMGASLNIMTEYVMRSVNINEASLAPSTILISRYDQSKKPILGKVIVQVQLDPAVIPIEFCMSSVATYDLFLGRP